MKKIILFANTSWYLHNFRLSLIESLINDCYQVICVAPVDNYTDKLKRMGVGFINIDYDNSSKNPLKDLLLLIRLVRVFKELRPDVVSSFTIKANIYGSIAARYCKIPIIVNVSGLGSSIIAESVLSKLVLLLYKIGLRKADKIFFENAADYFLFKEREIVSKQNSLILNGSGVDLKKFSICKWGTPNNNTTFLLAARLLKDKGIIEAIEAVRKLRNQNQNLDLKLLGQPWTKNPSSIEQHKIDSWIQEGLVTYLGFTDDVRPYIENADVVLLPSYREGMSRILLEAASMGKPLIATDVPGCREIINDGRSGFLCKVRDKDDLAEKMELMIKLTDEERALMGKRGRKKMEKEFDEKTVINEYLETINNLIL